MGQRNPAAVENGGVYPIISHYLPSKVQDFTTIHSNRTMENGPFIDDIHDLAITLW